MTSTPTPTSDDVFNVLFSSNRAIQRKIVQSIGLSRIEVATALWGQSPFSSSSSSAAPPHDTNGIGWDLKSLWRLPNTSDLLVQCTVDSLVNINTAKVKDSVSNEWWCLLHRILVEVPETRVSIIQPHLLKAMEIAVKTANFKAENTRNDIMMISEILKLLFTKFHASFRPTIDSFINFLQVVLNLNLSADTGDKKTPETHIDNSTANNDNGILQLKCEALSSWINVISRTTNQTQIFNGTVKKLFLPLVQFATISASTSILDGDIDSDTVSYKNRLCGLARDALINALFHNDHVLGYAEALQANYDDMSAAAALDVGMGSSDHDRDEQQNKRRKIGEGDGEKAKRVRNTQKQLKTSYHGHLFAALVKLPDHLTISILPILFKEFVSNVKLASASIFQKDGDHNQSGEGEGNWNGKSKSKFKSSSFSSTSTPTASASRSIFLMFQLFRLILSKYFVSGEREREREGEGETRKMSLSLVSLHQMLCIVKASGTYKMKMKNMNVNMNMQPKEMMEGVEAAGGDGDGDDNGQDQKKENASVNVSVDYSWYSELSSLAEILFSKMQSQLQLETKNANEFKTISNPHSSAYIVHILNDVCKLDYRVIENKNGSGDGDGKLSLSNLYKSVMHIGGIEGQNQNQSQNSCFFDAAMSLFTDSMTLYSNLRRFNVFFDAFIASIMQNGRNHASNSIVLTHEFLSVFKRVVHSLPIGEVPHILSHLVNVIASEVEVKAEQEKEEEMSDAMIDEDEDDDKKKKKKKRKRKDKDKAREKEEESNYVRKNVELLVILLSAFLKFQNISSSTPAIATNRLHILHKIVKNVIDPYFNLECEYNGDGDVSGKGVNIGYEIFLLMIQVRSVAQACFPFTFTFSSRKQKQESESERESDLYCIPSLLSLSLSSGCSPDDIGVDMVRLQSMMDGGVEDEKKKKKRKKEKKEKEKKEVRGDAKSKSNTIQKYMWYSLVLDRLNELAMHIMSEREMEREMGKGKKIKLNKEEKKRRKKVYEEFGVMLNCVASHFSASSSSPSFSSFSSPSLSALLSLFFDFDLPLPLPLHIYEEHLGHHISLQQLPSICRAVSILVEGEGDGVGVSLVYSSVCDYIVDVMMTTVEEKENKKEKGKEKDIYTDSLQSLLEITDIGFRTALFECLVSKVGNELSLFVKGEGEGDASDFDLLTTLKKNEKKRIKKLNKIIKKVKVKGKARDMHISTLHQTNMKHIVHLMSIFNDQIPPQYFSSSQHAILSNLGMFLVSIFGTFVCRPSVGMCIPQTQALAQDLITLSMNMMIRAVLYGDGEGEGEGLSVYTSHIIPQLLQIQIQTCILQAQPTTTANTTTGEMMKQKFRMLCEALSMRFLCSDRDRHRDLHQYRDQYLQLTWLLVENAMHIIHCEGEGEESVRSTPSSLSLSLSLVGLAGVLKVSKHTLLRSHSHTEGEGVGEGEGKSVGEGEGVDSIILKILEIVDTFIWMVLREGHADSLGGSLLTFSDAEVSKLGLYEVAPVPMDGLKSKEGEGVSEGIKQCFLDMCSHFIHVWSVFMSMREKREGGSGGEGKEENKNKKRKRTEEEEQEEEKWLVDDVNEGIYAKLWSLSFSYVSSGDILIMQEEKEKEKESVYTGDVLTIHGDMVGCLIQNHKMLSTHGLRVIHCVDDMDIDGEEEEEEEKEKMIALVRSILDVLTLNYHHHHGQYVTSHIQRYNRTQSSVLDSFTGLIHSVSHSDLGPILRFLRYELGVASIHRAHVASLCLLSALSALKGRKARVLNVITRPIILAVVGLLGRLSSIATASSSSSSVMNDHHQNMLIVLFDILAWIVTHDTACPFSSDELVIILQSTLITLGQFTHSHSHSSTSTPTPVFVSEALFHAIYRIVWAALHHRPKQVTRSPVLLTRILRDMLVLVMPCPVRQRSSDVVGSAVRGFLPRANIQQVQGEGGSVNVSESFYAVSCAENLSRLYEQLSQPNLRDPSRKFAAFILSDYCIALKVYDPPPSLRQALRTGVYCVMDTMTDFEFQQFSRSSDAASRAIFKHIHSLYLQQHQYKGQK